MLFIVSFADVVETRRDFTRNVARVLRFPLVVAVRRWDPQNTIEDGTEVTLREWVNTIA